MLPEDLIKVNGYRGVRINVASHDLVITKGYLSKCRVEKASDFVRSLDQNGDYES